MFYNLDKIENVHPLFQAVENCRGVEQNVKWHPEGDVFTHLIQTLHHALRESEDIDLIMASMLHDVGKAVHSHGHEKYTIDMIGNYISEKTSWLILNHMKIWTFILGEMKRKQKVLDLYNNQWFPELIILGRWDKMARRPNWIPKYDRVKIIDMLKIIQGG